MPVAKPGQLVESTYAPGHSVRGRDIGLVLSKEQAAKYDAMYTHDPPDETYAWVLWAQRGFVEGKPDPMVSSRFRILEWVEPESSGLIIIECPECGEKYFLLDNEYLCERCR